MDMREELAAGNASARQPARWQDEISRNLARSKQTILLLEPSRLPNSGHVHRLRRGGEMRRLQRAHGVPQTRTGRFCATIAANHVSPVPEVCPACGGKLKYTGFGTQRVEEELASSASRGAGAAHGRWTRTSRKNAHETHAAPRSQTGEYDIMLGTQMVAKGLDFERVTLVGVLGIDQLLFAQGYKAFENVFSLVTQVVGRGRPRRLGGPGAHPDGGPANHPVLNLAARPGLYIFFCSRRYPFRRLNLYPPFCTICLAGFSGAKTRPEVLAASRAFAADVQRLDTAAAAAFRCASSAPRP